jgi:hypothetical protein
MDRPKQVKGIVRNRLKIGLTAFRIEETTADPASMLVPGVRRVSGTEVERAVMIVKVSTRLHASASEAWGLVRKTSTMLYVCRGLLGLAGSGSLPETWQEGVTVRRRLLLCHLLPAWVHEIRIARIDDLKREFQTAERGGLLRAWNHTIRVEPDDGGRCRYTDRIEVRAGIWTAVAWLIAQVFFRYRQMRLRRLVRLVRARDGRRARMP